MKHYPDASLALISEDEIKQKLTTIFVDSIILDGQFRIALVSKNILDTLEFSLEEIKHQTVNYLSQGEVVTTLEKELTRGYFEEVLLTLRAKSGRPVLFSVSGFYLGLISDLNGYIVLKLKDLDGIRQLNRQLEDNRAELDRFIYRTAHDLRGPLATMRGLVNLLKLRKDDAEVDLLAGMLEVSAERLDDRLYKLLYLAETGDSGNVTGRLCTIDLEASLRETVDHNCCPRQVTFEFCCALQVLEGVHEQHVTTLMNNLMLYLVSLPLREECSILFEISRAEDGFEVHIRAKGVETDEKVRQAIRRRSSLYSDMLTYPHLVNYFAARKVAQKLNAHMRIIFSQDAMQEIAVFVPFLIERV